MKTKIKTYKQKGKTINGQYFAQIDIGEESQIIIVSGKLKNRNIIFTEIKKLLKKKRD